MSEHKSKTNQPQSRAVNPLSSEPIPHLMTRFAIPSIVALVVSSLYNIVDQIFIGHSVGILGNAATNVAFPLVTICTAFSLLCGIGAASNFNLSLGRGDEERAQFFVGNGISLMVGIGIILTILTRIFLTPLLTAFGATESILGYAQTYTSITSLGFPFLIITVGGSNLVRADGNPVYSMLCTLTGAILNCILDPLFIFGFGWGMAGAAWATVIGQVVSALMVIWYFAKKFKTVPVTGDHFRLTGFTAKRIVRLGIGPFFNQVTILVVQIAVNNIVVRYGALSHYGSDAPLAAIGIVLKINTIFLSICIGIAQGNQPIISYNYGAKKYHRVKKALGIGLAAAFAVSLVVTACFQLFPLQLIRLFGSGDANYYEFAVKLFRFYLMFTALNGLNPLLMNFFTSIGKAEKGIFIALSRQLIFFVPLLFLMTSILGLEGILYAAPISDMMAFVVAAVLVIKELKHIRSLEQNKLKIPTAPGPGH